MGRSSGAGLYEIASQDLASLQDDSVAEDVARALSLTLTAAERERVHRRYTQNAAAYTEFLKGRALLVDDTEPRMLEAIGRFEAALERDPSYALARASLAMAYASYSVRYVGEDDAGQLGARAEEQATLAIREDPNLAEAHLALASAAGTAYRNFDWPRVLEETAIALSLDPNLPLAHTARARALFHYGLFRATEIETETAAALAGGSSVEDDRMRSDAALHNGRFGEAVRLGEALHKRTDAVAIPTYLGLAFYYAGDEARAFEGLRAARRRGVPDLRAQAALASLEAAVGRHDAARTIVSRILAQTYRDHHIAYSLATTHAQLGQMDDAARWLTEAANTGFPGHPWFVRVSLSSRSATAPSSARSSRSCEERSRPCRCATAHPVRQLGRDDAACAVDVPFVVSLVDGHGPDCAVKYPYLYGIVVCMKKTMHIDERLFSRTRQVSIRGEHRYGHRSTRPRGAGSSRRVRVPPGAPRIGVRARERRDVDVNERHQPNIRRHDCPGRHVGVDPFPVESRPLCHRARYVVEPRRSEWQIIVYGVLYRGQRRA